MATASKPTLMVVTTGRADYGLLWPLLKKMAAGPRFDLCLAATGSHLSAHHGATVRLIEADGFVPVSVPMTAESDSEAAVCEAVSTGISGFARLFAERRPDLLIVLGDRYELWAACLPAVMHKIPIAHIHGGEATFGAMDDVIRHSITKMSALHFAATEVYAKRIMQMGEAPERVFTVGAIGLDNIKNIPLMSRAELCEYSGVDFSRDVALMTYHPVTLDSYQSAEAQVRMVLEALVKSPYTTLITMPNADPAGKRVYQQILAYTQRYPRQLILRKNLGQRGYLSAMRYAKLMVGNSSSGIIESASFHLPVVNIGDRQAGRLKPANVIDCACDTDAIDNALLTATSPAFAASVAQLDNPFGDGNTAERIMNVLESLDFTDLTGLIKKGFYEKHWNRVT